jgi:hypothetical protein
MLVNLRYNTYFKGGPDDRFISGLWIGNSEQNGVLFISCQFNGVQANFENCTFIDCEGAPNGKNCTYLTLDSQVRLTPQRKQENGEWA